MAQKDLVPVTMRTKEEQKKITTLGGIKSGEARRRKKTMREAMELMLSAKIPVDGVPEKLKEIGLTDEDMNVQTAIVYGQVLKAIKNGDTRSAEFCRDTVGEFIGAEVKEEKDRQLIYIPAKNLASSFVDLNRDIDNRKNNDYWLEGGRGSVKSSFWSEKLFELLENNPTWCAIIIRKVGNTLKDSVYAQMQWALDEMNEIYPGLQNDWKGTTSPLDMKKLSTGQRIYFRGADDPGKIKSIKPPKGMYIAVIVYEEFDQMAGMNEVRKIDQSVKRGGNEFVTMRIYNTPASSQHFVNKEKKIPKNGRLVHRSDYRSVPVEWLGQPFFDDAEYLQSINEKLYRNEYLGEETGTGDTVFENLEIREITDEEINSFENIYSGIDWGYYPDPFAYNKFEYNADKQTIYIFKELEDRKKGNEQIQEIMLEAGVDKNDLITADNEKKTVGDFRIWGWNMREAEKGPGSKEIGFKWLQTRAKIVIDPVKCPRTLDEFSNYKYDKDKDGNVITGYPDGQEDHHIACLRYATERVWKRRGN